MNARIMVVEDEDALTTLLRYNLEADGYNVETIARGDEADTKTPFDQQVRFVNAIREAGHHARLFPIDAVGETDHNAAAMTIPVAGACARGDSDEKLLKGIPRPAAKVASGS